MRPADVRHLHPGSFAFVMATGIVAIASSQHDLHALAVVLMWVAAVGYVALTALVVVRLVVAPGLVLADLRDHTTSFAFLTQVAATNVLGSAVGLLEGWWPLARVLWFVSLPLWVVWLYAALISEITAREKSDLEHGINGTWFMLTVSTASIAVLGALLVPRWDAPLVAFAAAGALCLGTVLYVIVMTMVFTRWSFGLRAPSQLYPPEWIAMGAMAITTLAGANLVAASRHEQLAELEPFVRGVTVLAWSTATFWFPLLVALGVWRHVVRRVPLTYSVSLWSMVFPLGMYAASSKRMFEVLDVPSLSWLPVLVLVVALIAWLATAVGMLAAFVRRARPARAG